MTKLIINKIVSLNKFKIFKIKNKIGQTPLILALELGNIIFIKLLSDSMTDFETKDRHGNTALHKAIDLDDFVSVSVLTERLIETRNSEIFNIKNKYGFTPLHLAIYKRNIYIINLVIESMDNFKTKDSQGNTTLMYSVKMGYKDITRLLIERITNLGQIEVFSIKDKKGITPLHFDWVFDIYKFYNGNY